MGKVFLHFKTLALQGLIELKTKVSRSASAKKNKNQIRILYKTALQSSASQLPTRAGLVQMRQKVGLLWPFSRDSISFGNRFDACWRYILSFTLSINRGLKSFWYQQIWSSGFTSSKSHRETAEEHVA